LELLTVKDDKKLPDHILEALAWMAEHDNELQAALGVGVLGAAGRSQANTNNLNKQIQMMHKLQIEDAITKLDNPQNNPLGFNRTYLRNMVMQQQPGLRYVPKTVPYSPFVAKATQFGRGMIGGSVPIVGPIIGNAMKGLGTGVASLGLGGVSALTAALLNATAGPAGLENEAELVKRDQETERIYNMLMAQQSGY
jgi:hypothetical protein